MGSAVGSDRNNHGQMFERGPATCVRDGNGIGRPIFRPRPPMSGDGTRRQCAATAPGRAFQPTCRYPSGTHPHRRSAVNTNAEAPSDRPIDRWFDSYSNDHRNAGNQLIHVFAVPLILWSVIALLWCVPVPGTWFRQGFWAAAAMFGAWMFYYHASRKIGFGML